MNDQAGVKSPENPGFKPKKTAGADLRRRGLSCSSAAARDPVENGRVSTRSAES
jgi:hypothetical protein